MKKLLKVSILLLTAALLFSGCSNASSSSEDDSLPGTWTENTGYYSSFAAPYQGSTLTGTNNTFVYTLTKPAEVADEDKPEEGTFSYYKYGVTKEKNFTGFKAKASCTSPNSGYGFIFCETSTENKVYSYYTLILCGKSFILSEKVNGTSAKLYEWTQDNAIETEPEENEIIVYTDDDSSIIININGSNVAAIRSPKLSKGACGICCNISSTDVKNNTPIAATYTFEEFQY